VYWQGHRSATSSTARCVNIEIFTAMREFNSVARIGNLVGAVRPLHGKRKNEWHGRSPGGGCGERGGERVEARASMGSPDVLVTMPWVHGRRHAPARGLQLGQFALRACSRLSTGLLALEGLGGRVVAGRCWREITSQARYARASSRVEAELRERPETTTSRRL